MGSDSCAAVGSLRPSPAAHRGGERRSYSPRLRPSAAPREGALKVDSDSGGSQRQQLLLPEPRLKPVGWKMERTPSPLSRSFLAESHLSRKGGPITTKNKNGNFSYSFVTCSRCFRHSQPQNSSKKHCAWSSFHDSKEHRELK